MKVQLNIKFHQFPYISSWDTVPTNFWRHTYRQTFSKNGQVVFRTSQNKYILRKPATENFREYFFLICIEESNCYESIILIKFIKKIAKNHSKWTFSHFQLLSFRHLNYLYGPVNKLWMPFIYNSVGHMFLTMAKMHVNFNRLRAF